MTIKDKDVIVHEYPLAKKGVNLWKNLVDLSPEESLFTQNLVWNDGMVKRGGQSLLTSNRVVGGSVNITGLHRFYYGSGLAKTLVACETTVKYYDGTTWQIVKSGLTNSKQTYFATWLDKAYIANGTDAPHKWDGTTDTAVSAAPATTKQFLPYQDRLLAIDTTGNLTWSNSFDDTVWQSSASCGVRPDTQIFGMAYHSNTNVSAGYQAKVLLGGANGMYLFFGSDLRTPSTTGNYTIFPLATSVGCNAPRTMVWTPKGTLYLGIDRMVYLLPFNSPTPVPVGQKITSKTHLAGIEGIEHIPTSNIANACAVYHNGYYILSVTKSGGTANTIQWWLDMNRLYQDDDGLWGPWYGPMVGQSISCFMVQSGNGDTGELYGGEGTAATGGFVYQLNQESVYGDNGAAISLYYQTFYNPLGPPYLSKVVHRMEVEYLNTLGTTNISFLDINGSLQINDTIPGSSGAVYWNDKYWNDDYWSSATPARSIVQLTPPIQPRRLSLVLTSSTSNDTFALYALRVEAIEQNTVFA